MASSAIVADLMNRYQQLTIDKKTKDYLKCQKLDLS